MTHPPRALGALTLLLLALACSPPDDRVSDLDLYVMILTEARSELRLPSPVAIHPLLALWPDGPVDVPLTRFNAYDSASVPAIVAAIPDAYHVCRPTPTGGCEAGASEVSVVLSSLREMKPGELAVRLVVFDRRRSTDIHRDYMIPVKRSRWGGWSVGRLERVN